MEKQEGMYEKKITDLWKAEKTDINRPRHIYVYRFPSFPSCAYVYYDEPGYIEQRLHYWEFLDILFVHNSALSAIPAGEKKKILDEIDSILPRPSGRLLEILETAYNQGMPKGQSPKEHYDNKM